MPAPDAPLVASDVLVWQIRQQMSLREIYTARDLKKRLAEVGYPISEAQISRLKKALPKHLDMRLLAGLCLVLDVSPGDLLVRVGVKQAARRKEDGGTHSAQASHQQEVTATDTPRKSILKDRVYPSSGPDIGPMSRGKI